MLMQLTHCKHGEAMCRRSSVLCRSTADNGKKPPGEGRKDLQEALENVMRLNIARVEALEGLESVTNDEKLKLIQSNEEAVEEIDAMKRLNADRRNLAFGSAQADIDEQYRIVQEELKKSRESMEADARDFEAFQDKIEADQQAGLWFKSLHARKRPKSKDHQARAAVAVKKVQDATVLAMRRRSRKLAYAFVVFVAGSSIIVDILSGRGENQDVQWQIALLSFIALMASYTSWREEAAAKAEFPALYAKAKSRASKKGNT